MASQSLTIPGNNRPTLRRSAKDVASGLSAYVISRPAPRQSAPPPSPPTLDNGADHAPAQAPSPSLVSVSLKRGDRLVGCTLAGHKAAVVDMEFLTVPGAHRSPAEAREAARVPGSDSEMYVLGTCDEDGVVFLWFLEIVRGADYVERALSVRRKYSFYSLRKSTDAHYARIRIAGTVAKGNMVLVPNDGSNVRIIGFSCDATPVEVDGRMTTELRIAAVPREGMGRRKGNAKDGTAMPGALPLAMAGSAAVGAGIRAGMAAEGMGERVPSAPSPSGDARLDKAKSGLSMDQSEEVFASSSSSDLVGSSEDGDDYGADEVVDGTSSSDARSAKEEENSDSPVLEGMGEMDCNTSGSISASGSDMNESDYEASSIAESTDFKDAQGAPLQHMAS